MSDFDVSPNSRAERAARPGGDWRSGLPNDESGVPALRRKRRRQRRRPPHRLLIALVVVLVTLGLAVAGVLVVVARGPALVPGCHQRPADPTAIGRNSFLYAAGGTLLGPVPTTHNREPVALERMSPWLPVATVAIEDRRFWQHGALDYQAIARAAIANLKAGRVVQGGSTLTQQFVRDRYLASEGATLRRKVDEACLAVQLARSWSKRQILEAYLNGVFYGHHAYGAEAAARTYFSRSARDLSLAQAALLAGLPQSPSRYDPLEHPRAARDRRRDVLRAMRSAGDISLAAYRRAVAGPLRLRPGDRYVRVRAPTFFSFVQRQLFDRYGPSRARHAGLRVRTTLQPRLQRDAQRAIAGWLRTPTDPAAALVAVDPASGAIRAMAAAAPGSKRLQFNLASQSRRQAGSAFKVFTLTAAIEHGIPLSSVWNGPPSLTIPSPLCLTASGPWDVHNFADESAGTMSLQQATAHSVNTIFAQVAVRVGPKRVVDVAHRMGIQSPLKPVCSITLGPEGVSPLEMTTAFATLAARGIRHRAQALRRVTAPNGDVLGRLGSRGRRVISQGVAHQVTVALAGVVTGGTGTAAGFGRPAAGKTGTAENFKDAWFCGYVSQLAACVWLGHPQAEIPMQNVAGFGQVVGGSVPARIWHDFMASAVG